MSWHLPVYQVIVQSALASGVLLALASAAVLALRQPARRIRVIELSLAALLLLPMIALLPGYPRLGLLPTPSSQPSAPTEPVLLPVAESPQIVAAPPVEDSLPVEPLLPEVATTEAALSETSEIDALFAEPLPSTVAESSLPSDVPLDAPTLPPHDLPPHDLPPREDVSKVLVPVELPSQPAAVAPASRARFDYRLAVVVVYLTGLAGMLLWSLLGLFAARRLLRDARPAPEVCRQILLALAGPRAGKVKLLISSRAPQPCALLAWQPTIVLPSSVVGASAESLRLMLAHEWSHVSRGDVCTWWLAGLMRAAFWYQPFVWWLREQLRLSQDYLADDAAARVAETPEDYAEFLTRYTASLVNTSLAAGLGIGGRNSNLHRRIVMLLNQRDVLESSSPRKWNVVMGLLVLLSVAGITSLAGQEKPPRKPAAIVATSAVVAPAPAKVERDLNVIQPLEVLVIDISPKLAEPSTPGGRCLVEPNGDVTLGPGFGHVNVKGLSVAKAEEKVQRALSELLRDVRVQIQRGLIARWRNERIALAHDPLQAGDRIALSVANLPEEMPIDGQPRTIEPGGMLALGPDFGRISVQGLSWAQAEQAITKQLGEMIKDPQVQVTPDWLVQSLSGAKHRESDRIQPGDLLQIRTDLDGGGVLQNWPTSFPLEPGGTVALGPMLGRVKIQGLTLREAEAAIAKHLETSFRDPQVSLTLGGYQAEPWAMSDNDPFRGSDPRDPLQALTAEPPVTEDEDLFPEPVLANPPAGAGSTAPKFEPGEFLVLEVAAAEGEDLLKKLIEPPKQPQGNPYGAREPVPTNVLEFTTMVQPDGDLCLGPICGRVKVAGLTAAEADEAIATQLAKTIDEPKVQVVRQPVKMVIARKPFRLRQGDQVMIEAVNAKGTRLSRPQQSVEPDGVRLGARFGRLKVEGLTIAEAEEALRKHLSQQMDEPQVALYVVEVAPTVSVLPVPATGVTPAAPGIPNMVVPPSRDAAPLSAAHPFYAPTPYPAAPAPSAPSSDSLSLRPVGPLIVPSTTPPGTTQKPGAARASTPPQSELDQVTAPADVPLQPLDTIEILMALKPKVQRGVGLPGEPDIFSGDIPHFSGTYVIEPDGDVALPHGYGRVKSAGLKSNELGTAIRNRLNERMFTRTALPKVHVVKRGRAVFDKDRTPGPDYKIRPGDRVLMGRGGPNQLFNILVNEAGELNESWDGKQTTIIVAGLTLAEAEEQIRKQWVKPSVLGPGGGQPWCLTLGGWHEEADPDVIDQIEGNDETRVQRIERELQELKSLIRGMQK